MEGPDDVSLSVAEPQIAFRLAQLEGDVSQMLSLIATVTPGCGMSIKTLMRMACDVKGTISCLLYGSTCLGKYLDDQKVLSMLIMSVNTGDIQSTLPTSHND